MRSLPSLTALLAFSLVASAVAFGGPLALAQSVDDAKTDAARARERAEIASGLVDDAIADREQLELQLAETISRVSELGSQLSLLGAGLDRTAEQLGFADVELAGIESAIEIQAVDAYMTLVASPSVSMVNSPSVEHAMVVSSVVEGVVESGQASVDSLIIKRRDLEALQHGYLTQQTEFQAIQDELNAEVEHLAVLYDQADTEVARAVRAAQTADAEHRAALSAVELAQARDSEQRRQERRITTTTAPPPTTPPETTVTTPAPPTTESDGSGSWDHPPEVERWRSVVTEFFPSSRVEEALNIIGCESNGDPEAYNPYSGASGLFQFIPSTWASTAPKAGYPDRSAFEPEPNVASAAWLANRYQELGLDYWDPWSCRRLLN